VVTVSRARPLRACLALAALLVIAALAVDCGPPHRGGGPVAQLSPQRRLQLIKRWRAKKMVTLAPEGGRAKAEFDRLVGPCSLFVGYVPKGWIATTPQGCRRLVIRPVLDGKGLATAAVVVEIAPATIDSAEACDKAVAENLIAWQWRDRPRASWTVREADYARWVGLKHTVGRTLVGRHGGQYFWVSGYWPLEYADEMLPRFDAILANWLWTDTGAPLESERARNLSGRRLPGV